MSQVVTFCYICLLYFARAKYVEMFLNPYLPEKEIQESIVFRKNYT